MAMAEEHKPREYREAETVKIDRNGQQEMLLQWMPEPESDNPETKNPARMPLRSFFQMAESGDWEFVAMAATESGRVYLFRRPLRVDDASE